MAQKILSLFIVAILTLVAGPFLLTPAQGEEPTLKVVAGSKGFASVELKNEVPVRAIQFDLTGVKISQVRTTDRSKGFLTKFNEQNGKVILLSTAGDKINPGKGAVLEVACDKPGAAVLSEVRIVEE